MQQMKLFVLTVFVFIALTSNSWASVVFSDGVFSDSHWIGQKFLSGSFSSFQTPAGGNPNEFRQMNVSGLNSFQSIIVVDKNTTAVYDPGVSGGISAIDFSFDLKFLGGTSGTSVVGYRLALEQSGSVYHSGPGLSFVGLAQGPGDGLAGTTWDPFSFSGLTAADFINTAGGPNTLDFSASGDPITFGYLATTGMSLPGVVDGGTSSGIDNWSVKVTPFETTASPVPEPASLVLLGGGLFGMLLKRKHLA